MKRCRVVVIVVVIVVVVASGTVDGYFIQATTIVRPHRQRDNPTETNDTTKTTQEPHDAKIEKKHVVRLLFEVIFTEVCQQCSPIYRSNKTFDNIWREVKHEDMMHVGEKFTVWTHEAKSAHP